LRPLLVVIFAAFGLGLAATAIALSGEPGFDGVRLGPWMSWPHLGAPDIDPYARAVAAFDGLAPIGINEGLSFVTSVDDRGAPLETRCAYEISGSDLPARLWTLAAYRNDGRPLANVADRQGLSSAGLLRAPNGDFVIEAARQARAGNWLPLGASATHGETRTFGESRTFVLALRLYQASTGALSSAYDGLSLPKITRGACS
jgi:hypothetical protein